MSLYRNGTEQVYAYRRFTRILCRKLEYEKRVDCFNISSKFKEEDHDQ